jgi:hypothetical protein
LDLIFDFENKDIKILYPIIYNDKKIFKKVVYLIHKLFIYFLILGAFLPKKYLFYYIIAWTITYIHWQFNKQRCILTQLEYFIDNKAFPPKVDEDNDYNDFPFIKSIFDELNIKIGNSEIHYMGIYGNNIFWLIGVIRYFRL